MSARIIKKSYWVDFRHNHQRYRIRSPDNSKAGAQAYEALMRQRLARGEPIKSPKRSTQTFSQFANEWFDTYAKSNNKFSEVKAKRSILDSHLIPFFGGLALAEVQAANVEQYKAAKLGKVGRPYVAKSVNNHLAVLRKCLRCAADWGQIPHLPLIKPLRVAPVPINYLNEDEYEALFNERTDQTAHLMILIAFHTGMRIGEIMALEWSCVNFAKQQITVCRSVTRGVFDSTKSNKIRHIPMTSTLMRELKPHRKSSGLVFTRKDGQVLYDAATTRWIRKACDRAGVRRVGWHLLRHTFASRVVSRGVPIRTLQKLLGHASITTTERYAHLAPTTLIDAVRVLEEDRTGEKWATGGQPDIQWMLKNLFEQTGETYEIARR